MSFPPPQATQGYRPRPETIATGQPGFQLGEQVLSPGQQRRRISKPHRLPGDSPALLIDELADSGCSSVGDYGARPDGDPATVGDR